MRGDSTDCMGTSGVCVRELDRQEDVEHRAGFAIKPSGWRKCQTPSNEDNVYLPN